MSSVAISKLYKQQIDFNSNADSKRFFNRLNNPFIVKKEQKLAYKISSAIPIGGKLVLEIGCGEGSNFAFLDPFLKDVKFFGVDFSFSKTLFFGNVFSESIVINANATALPFPDNSFDTVLIRDLLHHVNWARRKVISEALRVLKPNCKLVVIEANGYNPFNIIFRFCFPAENGLKDSTPKNLLNLCKKFGKTKICFLESSFLLRSLAFFCGWPDNWLRFFCFCFYGWASIWEKAMEKFSPKNFWPYMMLVIVKG